MLASLTNAKFAVPENPVMRAQSAPGGLGGFGRLGYAMGQPVILSDPGASAPGDMIVRGGASPGVNTTQGVTWGGGGWGSGGDAFGGPSNFPSGFQYSVGPNGQLQYADQGSDGVYTASFCNRIINGGGGSSADIFQCSIRGYVGANAVAPALIPPALVPDPPTSVTVPSAVMIASTTPPSYRPPVAKTQCGANAPGIGMSDCWLALIAGVVTYLLIGGNDGQRQ